MSPWSTTFTKLKTDDGFWEMLPSAGYTVGQEIEVDLDSRKNGRWVKKGVTWEGETIESVKKQADGKPHYYPCEVLDL